MDAIEGIGVGETRDFGNGTQGGGQDGGQECGEPSQGLANGLAPLLELVGRQSVQAAGWSNDFDGIRSEVDFRRAMAREEERLRGNWAQRLTRAVGAMGMSFWNSRPLRLLR